MTHSSESPEVVDSRSFDTPDDAAAAIFDAINDDELEEAPEEPAQALDDNSTDEPEGDELEGDEEEEASEGDEPEAVIEAPASLKAEEMEDFKALDPKGQEFIKNFAVRRDQEIQRGLAKSNDAQQQVKTEAASTVAEAKKAYANNLVTMAENFLPQPPDQSLRHSNPALFIQLADQYEAGVAQHNQIVQQATNIFQGAEQDEGALQNQHIQARDVELMKLPEVADEGTRGAFFDTALSAADELGLERDTLLKNGDASDFKNLHTVAGWKAGYDKWVAATNSKMERVRKGKTAKPNAAHPVGSGKKASLQKVQKQLRETGSDDAAMAAFEQMGI